MESLGDILKRLPAQRSYWSTSNEGDGSRDPENDRPLCPICNGKGWLRRRVPVGHPEFGDLVPCGCLDSESQENRLGRLLQYSNLGPLNRIRFSSTSTEGRSSDSESKRLFSAAFKAAEEFAEDPKGWLVFTGPSASGKTHLAAAIANRCIDRGQTVFFMFVPDFLDHLRTTFSPESTVPYDELFQQLRNAPVLVLDDLGSHSSTSWAREKLLQVFNHRFNAQLPTVITVRGPFERLDEGIRARMEMDGFSTTHSIGWGDTQLLREIGGLEKDMLSQMTFENFKVDQHLRASSHEKANLKWAFDIAKSFTQSPKGWLLLAGPTGCGKTHLAVAIINERLNQGQASFFAFVPTLLDHLRATFRPDSLTGYDELFEEVKRSPLLVLDDLASENSTPWAEEKLYQIIVHRHNARLATLITTNLESLKQLEEAKPRIRSRLSESWVEWVPILAPDYRDQGSPARSGQRPQRRS